MRWQRFIRKHGETLGLIGVYLVYMLILAGGIFTVVSFVLWIRGML